MGACNSPKNSLHRVPSVEDLFVPMWRLDVQGSAPSSFPKSVGALSLVDAALGSFARGKKDLSSLCTSYSTVPRFSGAEMGMNPASSSMIPLPYSFNGANVSKVQGQGCIQASSEAIEVQENCKERVKLLEGGCSTSDEEQHVMVDERKQKRMLSNRESARRSRLRKQQHLEELRAQLVQLRAENNVILSKVSMASQQFSRLNHENQLLKTHAIDLTRQLQAAAAQHPGGLRGLGFGPSHLDPPSSNFLV